MTDRLLGIAAQAGAGDIEGARASLQDLYHRHVTVSEVVTSELLRTALLGELVAEFAALERVVSALGVLQEVSWQGEPSRSPREWAAGVGLGATGGAAAAFFGVGMAPYLQLGFLAVHRLPLRQTVGTTMLALVFISAAGALALARHGDVSLPHLIGLTAGLGSGAYLGARFTRRAPRALLRGTIITIPIVAGGMLLFL